MRSIKSYISGIALGVLFIFTSAFVLSAKKIMKIRNHPNPKMYE